MAQETQPKRQRDQETLQDSHHDDHPEDTDPSYKRQKPCNNDRDIILNLLEEEQEQEDETSTEVPVTGQDHLSAIFTTLQQELSFDFGSPPCTAEEEPELPNDHQETTGGDEGLKHSVMRHLLEASDDELGIPNGTDNDSEDINHVEIINSSEDDQNLMPFDFNDNGLMWELEDEAANYYTVLQSELLFM